MTTSTASIRPLRFGVRHTTCKAKRREQLLDDRTAEQLAADPTSAKVLRCSRCGTDVPVAEFVWFDGTVVGS